MTSVSGGQGDPIIPRRIKAGKGWSWNVKDDEKVEELRGWWWKERCNIQTDSRNKADAGSQACNEPFTESTDAAQEDQRFFSSKKQKVGSAPSGVRQEGKVSGDGVAELSKEEKMTGFQKHLIPFKDLLLRTSVSKVVISGFVNGRGGHVMVPESLLGTIADSQMLFVFCEDRIPSVTSKLVQARAFGLRIVDSRFLIKWGETTILPDLEEFPVKNEWSSNATGLSKFLTPLSDKIFSGQTFAFFDTEHWMMSPDQMASMITQLGGKVVSPDELDHTGFGLSSTSVTQLEVFHPDWVVRMVLAGQDLPNIKWRMVDAEEEMVCSASQVTTLHVLHHLSPRERKFHMSKDDFALILITLLLEHDLFANLVGCSDCQQQGLSGQS